MAKCNLGLVHLASVCSMVFPTNLHAGWFCLHSPEFFTDAVTIYFVVVLQALAKQFADILHFTLTFDDLKVSLPYLLLFGLWMYLS